MSSRDTYFPHHNSPTMMHSATYYTSESNSDQERSVDVQSQHMYGNMHTFSMLPHITGHPVYFPSPFYSGSSQVTFQPSFPGLTYGHVIPANAFVTLPNVPVMHPPFFFILPQITGAAMYYPFPFQPLLPQIMYQPSFSVGHVPQLNDTQFLSVAPCVPFPLHNPRHQVAYQLPVEPAELASNSLFNDVTQPQSISQPSLDPTFDDGQQPYDSSVPSQVQSTALVCTNNIYPSSSNSVEQPQTTYEPPLDLAFNAGQQLHDSTLPSQETVELVPTNNMYPPCLYYPGQAQTTYQPSSNPAFFREQMYDYDISNQAQGAVIEHVYTPQEPNNEIEPTSEICPVRPIHAEEPQSTYLSYFQSASNYPLELSGSQLSSSALDSVNPGYSYSPNYSGSYSHELFDPLAVADFRQTSSSQYMTPSLKRAADKIYPLGSELNISGQCATATSFEDAPRPRKRLKEADNGSPFCIPEERMQSLAAIMRYPNLESFQVDRISHGQRLDLPVQSDQSIDTQCDTSMLHSARNIRISGNPTFTNIGVNNVTNHSGDHNLEILTKFVSFDALHDSSAQDPDRRCHPGTRANVLARLQAWTDDPSASEQIVWLHGLPGAGKSSVAQTIIRSCGREKVVASFFFYRSDPGRNDGNRLFTTIAWQLASSIPGIKRYLVDSLAHRPDLPMKDVETQFEELVVQPFHALNGSASQLELPSVPVVVIDGVDECTDDRLQRRILNVIGNAIRNCHVPLRFLILSRPEAHIKEAVDEFNCPALCIDLDRIDNANHDIERYFNAEFSRIVGEQNIDMTWPGHDVIQQLVFNSSGQFVYATTVIKYVGDTYNCAKAQLDIILGLRKRQSASPFAPLDDLYTEILKRQPDQDFLKNVLTMFIACNSTDCNENLHSDFPMLLDVSEEEMGRKLRGMQSLLVLKEGYIDIHHRSFLDFLQDVSRSGQYHISKQASSKRYLELITDTIIRHVSDIIDHPQCHDMQHFHLKYVSVSRWQPLEPELAIKDMREVLQPLVDLQDKLLNLPNFTSIRNFLSCNKCNGFEIMRNLLLHLSLSQAQSYCIAPSVRATGLVVFEHEKDRTSATIPKIGAENDVSDLDLDRYFDSLLAYIRNIPSTSSPPMSVLESMYPLLRFDCVKIAKKVSSVLDAQNLMNLIYCMMPVHNQNSIKNSGINLRCKAFHLVREIYARVPVVPQSLFFYENPPSYSYHYDEGLDIEDLCSKALVAGVLNLRFTDICGLMLDGDNRLDWVFHSDIDTDFYYNQLSKFSNASQSAKFQAMMEISKSIQYFHSISIVLSCEIYSWRISVDSEFHLRFHISDLKIKGLKLEYTYENSVFTLGRLFYEMYFNVQLPYGERRDLKRDTIVKRPSEPEIREDAWQLIQRCCAEDPESRPTIDEVVQEMESWGIQSESDITTLTSSVDSDF